MALRQPSPPPRRGRETQPPGSFLDHVGFDRSLAALAGAQQAVFSLAQLNALGITGAGVRKRAASGRLHRVHHAVYSLVPPELLTLKGRYMAAVLACGPGAVISHRSAAQLLGLRATGRSRIDVTVPRRSARRHEGIDVHRSLTLTDADLATIDGIPCTTVARAFLDIACVINRRGLERMLDQAEAEGVLNLPAIARQVELHPRRRGAGKLRAVLDEHIAGSTFTWSEFEERFLGLCRRAKLPQPEVNAWIVLDDGDPAIRGDFVWRELRAVVETDGDKNHRTRAAFELNRRNDQRLTLAGWGHVRITWIQLRTERKRIEATVRKLLRL